MTWKISPHYQMALSASEMPAKAADDVTTLPSDSFLNYEAFDETKARNRLKRLTLTLKPSEEFISRCKKIADMLSEFLKNRCSFNVSSAVLGGSLGKGLALNDKSDMDVVIFIGGLRNMADFLANRTAIKNELAAELQQWKSRKYLRFKKITTVAVTVQMRNSIFEDFLDVDIVPTFDNLSHHPNLMSVYVEINRLRSAAERYEYQPSFIHLEIMFNRHRTCQSPALIDLIRLVKYWKKTHFPKISDRLQMLMPSSYAMELIVIHLWEKAGSPAIFPLDRAFKCVLTALAHPWDIYAYWTEFYDPIMFVNRATRQHGRPFIMDPLVPFINPCGYYLPEIWELISRLAVNSINSPLLRNVRSCQWI